MAEQKLRDGQPLVFVLRDVLCGKGELAVWPGQKRVHGLEAAFGAFPGDDALDAEQLSVSAEKSAGFADALDGQDAGFSLVFDEQQKARQTQIGEFPQEATALFDRGLRFLEEQPLDAQIKFVETKRLVQIVAVGHTQGLQFPVGRRGFPKKQHGQAAFFRKVRDPVEAQLEGLEVNISDEQIGGRRFEQGFSPLSMVRSLDRVSAPRKQRGHHPDHPFVAIKHQHVHHRAAA